MQFDFRDDVFKTRSEWSSYEANIQRLVPRTKRIVLNSWEFPELTHNSKPVNQLAVVINSNLGIVGLSGSERSNILVGQNVKQIIFNRNADNTWSPINNINYLDYVSESTIFTFKLRMGVRGVGFINVPLQPRQKWKLNVNIV